MADSQSNVRLRADAGTPTSGVIHVRTRLTADFTVIANALAQRRGSAVTVGVAAYILSLPDGSPVSITALCGHFTEGEILISRALRELEEAGYLERRRERTSTGKIRTRTYFYDVPGSGPPDGPPEPPRPPRPREPGQPGPAAQTAAPRSTAPEATPATAQNEVAAPAQDKADGPVTPAKADPEAVAVLAALRRIDPRLVLSRQEAARLAPDVTRWLASGVPPAQITQRLTASLPDRLHSRPANILAFRLRDTPLPAPVPTSAAQQTARPIVLPLQTCDGCDRAFRAPEPGRCRDCRRPEAVPVAA
jgi:hypothetical protein